MSNIPPRAHMDTEKRICTVEPMSSKFLATPMDVERHPWTPGSLNQSAMRYYKRIGYHDFEGVASDLDERARIVADLGEHKCLVLKHHGLLTAGVNIGEAFNLMYYLEKSCETQMMVLASNEPYSLPSEASCEKSARIFWG